MSFMRKIIPLFLVICFILPAPGYTSPVVTDPDPPVPLPGILVPHEPSGYADEVEEEQESVDPYEGIEIIVSEIPRPFVPIIESMHGDPAELELPIGLQYHFPIDEIGPTVVVVLHGKTSAPARAEAEGINSILHPYYYWGFDFVRALLNPGGRNLHVWNERGKVEEFDGFKWRFRGLSLEEMFNMIWIMVEVMVLDKFSDEIIQIYLAYSVDRYYNRYNRIRAEIAELVEIYNTTWGYEFDLDKLCIYDFSEIEERKNWLMNEFYMLVETGKSRLGVIVAGPTEDGVIPGYSVMLTYRDGSRSLGEQAVNVVNQVYDNYQKYFGHLPPEEQPEIVLVAHSMGGLVSRYILTNPTEHVGGHMFTQQEREKADFIRDRTRYLATLATPHEGSHVADHAFQIAEAIYGEETPANGVWTDDGPTRVKLFGILQVWKGDSMPSFLHADLPATAHCRTDYWANLNLGHLAPHNAVRTDGTLVPVYALTGRTPTSGIFDDPSNLEYTPTILKYFLGQPKLRLSKLLRLEYPVEFERPPFIEEEINKLPGRCALEVEMCMLGDFLVNIFGSWGDVPSGIHGEQMSQIRRVVVVPEYQITTTAGPVFGTASDTLFLNLNFPAHQLQGQCDGRADNDSIVSFTSGVGFNLGTNQNEYFSYAKQWPVDGHLKRGSWYRFYEGPWDLLHHGSIKYRGETGGWLLEEIVSKAGPYVGPGPLSDWTRREFILEVDSTNVPRAFISSNTGHGGRTSYDIKGINLDQEVELQAQQRTVIVSYVPLNIQEWYFTGWSGSVTANERNISLVMDEDISLTAHYEEPFTLRVGTLLGVADVTIESSTGHGGIANYTLPGLLPGETVTLEAPEFVGSGMERKSFNGWLGALTSQDREITFVMDRNKSLTAIYVADPEGLMLEVNSLGDEQAGVDITSDTGHGGKTKYHLIVEPHVKVHLEAPEYVGSGVERKRFSGWSGAVNSADRVIAFVMDDHKKLTANYAADPAFFILIVNSAGDEQAGLDITSNTGHGGKSNYMLDIEPRAKVHLEAPEYVGSGVERKRFSAWSGAISSQNTGITFVMDDNKRIVANYVSAPEVIEAPPRYTLTVNSTGDDRVGVDIVSNTGHSGKTNYQLFDFTPQAKIHLEAPEYLGSGSERKRFSSWSGAISSSNRSINLTMDDNKTVTVNYVADPVIVQPRLYTLSVSSAGAKIVPISSFTGHGGTTDYSVTGIKAGAQVYLEAPEYVGSGQNRKRFAGWSGASSSKKRAITLTMNSNLSVTANYADAPEAVTHTLEVKSEGFPGVTISSKTGHGGTTNYTRQVVHGTEVHLMAPDPPPGYFWQGWLVNGVEVWERSITIKIDRNTTVTAHYFIPG